jgi:hypothetical protein
MCRPQQLQAPTAQVDREKTGWKPILQYARAPSRWAGIGNTGGTSILQYTLGSSTDFSLQKILEASSSYLNGLACRNDQANKKGNKLNYENRIAETG